MRRKLSITTAVLLFCNTAVLATEPTKGEKIFALHLKTLFAEKCNACHGADPDQIEGGLNMLTRESIIAGGDSYGEEVLIPGKGEESFLYVATTRKELGYEMPPKEAEKLTEQQTWLIRDWITEGAPWPDEDRVASIQQEYAEGEIVETSGGLDSAWTNRRYKSEHLWAYRPIKVGKVPAGHHPVDWFIGQKLKEKELSPAGIADASQLARRMSFGLTGLPPSFASVQRFAKTFQHDSRNAVKNYAKELMNSSAYGEHFGRQWLDVARYADTAGFANDFSRPNAWRYRDYVIRAFNSDKPYNEFVRQQIAGDEIDSTDAENLIATGFLRMGPWEQTAMSVFRETRVQWLDDVTDSVGQTFLGHALQCAKCHDHKFDPVPTRDYYSMMAVFSTTQFVERNVPFLASENKTGFQETNDWITAKIKSYKTQLGELNRRIKANRKKEAGNAKVGDNGLDPGDEASMGRMNKNISRHSWEYDRFKPIAFSVYTGATTNRKFTARLKMPKERWNQKAIETDTVLDGGDVYSRGDEVTPAPLSAAQNLGRMQPASFPSGRGKRRLHLADWIVDPNNPLTSRVIVNRVWAWHFGKGLAGNPNNFGATGKLPTHPALLDYLADWFMKNGWSIKKLNELIVTSDAYQRSTRHTDVQQLSEKDSKRDFYAVFLPRRMTAEEFRDSMLACSGELNRQLGGIPCRPDIHPEVAVQPRQIMGGTASVYEPDPLPKHRNRRSIYAEKIRGLRDPFFETFNQPGPEKSCELRETSTVTPQALTLMNSEEIQERALAFAARLMSDDSTDTAKINQAFQIALGRRPSEQEQNACLDHWIRATADEQKKTYGPREYPVEIKRTVMAEKTGEPYDFIEKMPAFETYVPDLQPHQTDAETRGLAQVCLVLFNSNEFAYLD